MAGRARSPGLTPPATDPDDVAAELEKVRAAARSCRRCPLWAPATQTVFGEGAPDARWLHDEPRNVEIVACIPWLEQELALVRPDVVVLLGATTAKAVIGKDFSVEKQRGELADLSIAPYVFATVHPSALLRARQFAPERWREDRERFVADLRRIPELLATGRGPRRS